MTVARPRLPRRRWEQPDRAAVDLRTRVGEVTLANPVMTASGTAGHGAELGGYVDLAGLGAVVVKSVSAEPWPGNPPPRLYSVEGGMLNSVGLQNRGAATWLVEDLPPLLAAGATVVGSIWGRRAEDYQRAAAIDGRGAGQPVVAVEANISCPNLEDRSRMFAHSRAGVCAAIGAAVAGLAGSRPLWAKLSPNVTDLPELAARRHRGRRGRRHLDQHGHGPGPGPRHGSLPPGRRRGGLSGPAIHPVAVRAVYECRAALPGVPIVGVGGVTGGETAAELLAAGADAVQVGTATFADPRAPGRVVRRTDGVVRKPRNSTIDELKGRAHGRH